jgi:membrane protein YqaA with SNARE-associated domain
MFAYLSLMVTAFLAATVVPFYSEALLLVLLQQGKNAFWLWASATAGNTLGSIVNWYIGRYSLKFRDSRWFPVSPKWLARAQRWFAKYGVWSLLFTWLPIGGDTLTLVAGIMRVNFWIFLVLVCLGKAARYAMAIYAFEAVT